MTQKGMHTWDLILKYHRCPACGYIFESREDYVRRGDRDEKDLVCHRCKHPFMVTKARKRTFGPIWN